MIVSQYFVVGHYWDQIAKLALQINWSSFEVDLKFAEAIGILAAFFATALPIAQASLSSVIIDCLSSITKALMI